jgi:hypothetical protein
MIRIVVLALLLAGCSQDRQPQARHSNAVSKPLAVAAAMPTAGQSKTPLWIPIPKDKAQLQRLLAMGYKIHEDHLHAPGVTSCPKMSENPVQ